MFDNEDYGFLTGGLGDLNGDGKVDFTEYIIEEDDFQRIMGINDDGNPFSDDDFDNNDFDVDDFDNDDFDFDNEY